MIKDEIKVVVLTSDFQMLLLANKRKAFAEFEQEIFNPAEECLFQLPFGEIGAETEKTEVVGVLNKLLGEIGLWCGKSSRKIRQRLALAPVQLGFDLMNQYGTRPAMFHCLPCIP